MCILFSPNAYVEFRRCLERNTYFLWIKPNRPVGMKSFLLLAHLKTVPRRNLIQDVNDTPSFPKMERSLSGVCIFLYESLMQLLTRFFFFSRSLKIFLFGRFSFPLPYNDTIFFRLLLFLFVTCVGIASVRLGGPSIHNHNKGETMSKRPPLGTTGGKLALAGKCSRARQLLEREQRERDRRDLLSLVGKEGKTHHPTTKGMLLALQALRRLVSVSASKILIFVRMVLPTLPRKLYLIEMEVSLNLRLSLMGLMRNMIRVRRMMRTPMIHRDHLDPLVAERE